MDSGAEAKKIRNLDPSVEGLGLYLITGRPAPTGGGLLSVVDRALGAGARFIQLREKDLGGGELLSLAVKLRELTRSYGALLLINDRVDVALASEADGVHLGVAGINARDARRLAGGKAILGVSAHSLQEALDAEAAGADFITFGPVYHTPSKARYGEPVGVGLLKEVCREVRIPVYALGGVGVTRIKETVSAGASGAALISAVMAAPDAYSATKSILEEIRSAQAVSKITYKRGVKS